MIRSVFLVGLLAACVQHTTQAGPTGKEFYGIRKRNSYTLYKNIVCSSFRGKDSFCYIRGVRHQGNRPMKFPRDKIIIDSPPLRSVLKPGTKVLAPLGVDKHGAARLAPAKIVKQQFNGDFRVRPVCGMDAIPVGIHDSSVHKRVPDNALTASSAYAPVLAPHNARLHSTYLWCPSEADSDSSWLQVDLQKQFFICSVAMTGFPHGQYTKSFNMKVSNDGKNFTYVKKEGTNIPKVFVQHNKENIARHFLNLTDRPYRYVRFYPVTYYTFPCLGVEVYGHGGVQDPRLIFPLDKLRMPGSVCNVQTNCSKTANAVCGREKEKAGEYTCKCPVGFRGPSSFEPGDGSARCKDVNECFATPSVCTGANMLCNNTNGSYQCKCKKGFAIVADRKSCKDIDECSGNLTCDSNAKCLNSIGSYECKCKDGFRGNGHVGNCRDINECLGSDDKDPCLGGKCINTLGSFNCTCLQGYTFDKNLLKCKDFDECKHGTHDCPKHMLCKNTVGSYECKCKRGYTKKAGKCVDVDECKTMRCRKNHKCENTTGSYKCVYKQGYNLAENTKRIHVKAGKHRSGQTRHVASIALSHIIVAMTTVVLTST